jgi:site-specific DNA-methyltransferase (adenine-specific)
MGSGGEDKGNKIYGHYRDIQSVIGHNDNGGSASRFFYCAKASKSERNKGCEELPLGEPPASARSKPAEGRKNALGNPRTNNHPTVKPIALMEYLVKLVSREGALVLDPFAGSGSTLIACKNLNRKYIGFERESDYVEISNKRLSQVSLLDILNSSGDTV